MDRPIAGSAVSERPGYRLVPVTVGEGLVGEADSVGVTVTVAVLVSVPSGVGVPGIDEVVLGVEVVVPEEPPSASPRTSLTKSSSSF